MYKYLCMYVERRGEEEVSTCREIRRLVLTGMYVYNKHHLRDILFEAALSIARATTTATTTGIHLLAAAPLFVKQKPAQEQDDGNRR